MNAFEELLVPNPFLINPLKHHLGFIRDFVRHYRLCISKKSRFYADLKNIGNSVTDIYCGTLPLMDIFNGIEWQLKSTGNFLINDYKRFIDGSGEHFRKIKIKDGSEWTLLLGTDPDRYIHLHPARGSSLTIRAKANAMKIAIVLKTYYMEEMYQRDFVDLINQIRIESLRQSPIKDLNDAKGIRKVLELL